MSEGNNYKLIDELHGIKIPDSTKECFICGKPISIYSEYPICMDCLNIIKQMVLNEKERRGKN